MRWRLWPLVVVLVLALCGLASAAGQRPGLRRAEPPPLSTAYVAQLRVVSAQVEASLREITALPAVNATNKPALVAAGKRLELAAAATRDMLRTYRDASTRYGTAEEWRLSQKLLTDLLAARTVYGQRAGVTLPVPTAKQRSEAQQLFEASVAVVASEQIVRWTGDEGLAEALTAGSLKTVKARLGQELTTRVRRQAEKAINDATGLSLVLNVPLKQQVRFQIERLASNWLARAVLNVSPQGLLIQLAGRPIVNWVVGELEAALRQKGNPVGRAEDTMAQLATWRSQLLLLSPTSSLATARGLSAKIERELGRSGFLKLDLRRARKTEVLGRLEQAESLTRTSLAVFRSRFLLDSAMARADLNAMVDQAKRLLREIEEITRKLGTTSSGGSKRTVAGDWESYDQSAFYGVIRVRITSTSPTTFVAVLLTQWKFGSRNCVVPAGQEVWRMTFDPISAADPNHPAYNGTARSYDFNTCAAGVATGLRWVYHPDEEVLRARPATGSTQYKRVG